MSYIFVLRMYIPADMTEHVPSVQRWRFLLQAPADLPGSRGMASTTWALCIMSEIILTLCSDPESCFHRALARRGVQTYLGVVVAAAEKKSASHLHLRGRRKSAWFQGSSMHGIHALSIFLSSHAPPSPLLYSLGRHYQSPIRSPEPSCCVTCGSKTSRLSGR